MKLEEQVCSLELAKRLKELGVKQDSVYSWANHEDKPELTSTAMTALMAKRPLDRQRYISDDVYSAFTVAELGEMLPYKIEPNGETYWYATGKCKKDDRYYAEHEISYGDSDNAHCLERDASEANCRAKMLIWLIENGHVKI